MTALGVLVWKELVYFRAYPLGLLNETVSPALLVAPYILVARMFGFDEGLTDSVAVGLLLWYWLSTLMWEVGFGVQEEMEEGVLESVLASPTPVVVLLGAKGLATLLENSYLTACMVGWFHLFGVRLPLPWPAFVGVLVLTGLGVVGLMLLQAGLVLLLKRASAPGDIIQTALGALSGMTMPARLLPRPLWALSRAIPVAYGIEAARGLLGGRPLGPELLLLVALGVGYGFLGWRALTWAEGRMRVAGTTGEF